MIQYRRCKACEQYRPISEYSKSPKRIDGLNAKCYACRSADYKEYRKRVPRDKEKAREYAREYAKRRPPLTLKQKQARAAFRRDHYQRNKEKMALQHKDYLRRHPGKNSEQASLYRLRSKNQGVFIFTEKDIRKLSRATCAYCGASGKMSIDHVMPVSKGGRNSIGNLLPACRTCNSEKHAKLLIVWRLQRIREGRPVIFETIKLSEDK
jgi:5-methylcytosine-specific restriction endonuclease McrA